MRIDLLGKLFGLFALTDFAGESGFIHRIFRAMAALVTYAVLTGMLAGGLVIGVLYAGYRALQYYGVESDVALAVVLTITLLITALAGLKVKLELARLTSLQYRAPSSVDLIADKLRPVVDSFWSGFNKGKTRVETENFAENQGFASDTEAPDERTDSQKPRAA